LSHNTEGIARQTNCNAEYNNRGHGFRRWVPPLTIHSVTQTLNTTLKVLTDEQTAMKNAATVAVKAAAAAVPCATFESSINAEGEAICTMKVDKVESLRTNDD
jgi:hypothetical protein